MLKKDIRNEYFFIKKIKNHLNTYVSSTLLKKLPRVLIHMKKHLKRNVNDWNKLRRIKKI